MRAAAIFLGTLAVTILPPATDGARAILSVCCHVLALGNLTGGAGDLMSCISVLRSLIPVGFRLDVGASQTFAAAIQRLCDILYMCFLPYSLPSFFFFSSSTVYFFSVDRFPESYLVCQGSSPGSSPVFQLHLIHEEGRDILPRKLLLSQLPPGDLSRLGLWE